MIFKLSNMINLCELSYIRVYDIQGVKDNLCELIYIQLNGKLSNMTKLCELIYVQVNGIQIVKQGQSM